MKHSSAPHHPHTVGEPTVNTVGPFSRRPLNSRMKLGAAAITALVTLGALPACSTEGNTSAWQIGREQFQVNEQLRQIATEMRSATQSADPEAAEFLEGQLRIIEEEFYRQCGVDEAGEKDPACVLDDEDSKASTTPSRPTPKRSETFAKVQEELLAAITSPELPRGQEREEDSEQRHVTREEFQTQLLTGLYAATAPVSGRPTDSEFSALLADPALEGIGVGSGIAKELAAALDEVYGAIQASGLTQAAAAGTEAAGAIEAAGDDARTVRDMLTSALSPAAASAENSVSEAEEYVPPAGFGLVGQQAGPPTLEKAPAFLHESLAAPLSQLRQLSGRADSGQLRSMLAQASALLSRAQGKLELIQGLDPAGITLRGGD